MSNCADVCLMEDIFDMDECEFYREKVVTARRAHTCCECGGAIKPKERYERVFGKWDGDPKAFATCSTCLEIRNEFTCGSWMFGGLWPAMREQMFPVWKERGPYDCLAKLETKTARDVCVAAFQEWSAKQ